MTQMACEKNKGPAEPGLVLLFSFCQDARRAGVGRSHLGRPFRPDFLLGFGELTWLPRAYLAAASFAIECESRDTFRLALFL
jgi:hypothetical protein